MISEAAAALPPGRDRLCYAPLQNPAFGAKFAMESITADPSQARGVLLEKAADRVVMAVRGTEYKLHLVIDAPVATDVNKRIAGRVIAEVNRVDQAVGGGRFVEPVMGRPRRLQGEVIATDVDANTLTIGSIVPFVCKLMVDQQAGDFQLGMLVGCDVRRGARFEPAG